LAVVQVVLLLVIFEYCIFESNAKLFNMKSEVENWLVVLLKILNMPFYFFEPCNKVCSLYECLFFVEYHVKVKRYSTWTKVSAGSLNLRPHYAGRTSIALLFYHK